MKEAFIDYMSKPFIIFNIVIDEYTKKEIVVMNNGSFYLITILLYVLAVTGFFDNA